MRESQPEARMSEIEWWRLKAAEINALAARDAVVIVPVGSTEQHGPHLPTQVDSLLVGEIARRAPRLAAASTPVVVAPTVWTGLAEPHMHPGATLSLDLAPFQAWPPSIRGTMLATDSA